jgi:hypothetical protein
MPDELTPTDPRFLGACVVAFQEQLSSTSSALAQEKSDRLAEGEQAKTRLGHAQAQIDALTALEVESTRRHTRPALPRPHAGRSV